jgi:hypothetical protein
VRLHRGGVNRASLTATSHGDGRRIAISTGGRASTVQRIYVRRARSRRDPHRTRGFELQADAYECREAVLKCCAATIKGLMRTGDRGRWRRK